MIGGVTIEEYDAYDKETITVSSSVVGFSSSKITNCKIAFCTLDADGGAIRYWMDGSNPTSSEGHYVAAGGSFTISGNNNIRNFKAIRAGADDGKLQVTYKK